MKRYSSRALLGNIKPMQLARDFANEFSAGFGRRHQRIF
jgi:hypothetical protein